jgi:uncharacterized membrane protein YqjE
MPLSGESPEMKLAATDSVQAWIASFQRYLELGLQLIGLEAREAGLHLLITGLLLAGALVCLAGFVILLLVFLLYLMTLILHWDWCWCALVSAGGLLLIGVVIGIIFRARLTKTLFPLTLAELQKDCQWLIHDTPINV